MLETTDRTSRDLDKFWRVLKTKTRIVDSTLVTRLYLCQVDGYMSAVMLMPPCVSPQNPWSPVRTPPVYWCIRLQPYCGLWFCRCGRSLLRTARQHEASSRVRLWYLALCACSVTLLYEWTANKIVLAGCYVCIKRKKTKLWLTRDRVRNKTFSDPHHWLQSGLSGLCRLRCSNSETWFRC